MRIISTLKYHVLISCINIDCHGHSAKRLTQKFLCIFFWGLQTMCSCTMVH